MAQLVDQAVDIKREEQDASNLTDKSLADMLGIETAALAAGSGVLFNQMHAHLVQPQIQLQRIERDSRLCLVDPHIWCRTLVLTAAECIAAVRHCVPDDVDVCRARARAHLQAVHAKVQLDGWKLPLDEELRRRRRNYVHPRLRRLPRRCQLHHVQHQDARQDALAPRHGQKIPAKKQKRKT